MKAYLVFFVVLLVGLGQTVSAENLYLKTLKRPLQSPVIQTENKELLQRIKNFEARKSYTIKHLPAFHKQTELRDEPLNLCQNCHGILPHKQNEARRAFLNQHAQRIDCMTCHFQASNFKLDYRWSTPNPSMEKRIIPEYQGESLIVSATAEIAQKIKTDWDQADLHQKVRIHQQVHQGLNFDKEKVQCGECHQENGLLDLESLAFDKEKIQKIESNLISRFLEKLKTKKENSESDKHNEKPRILLRGLLK